MANLAKFIALLPLFALTLAVTQAEMSSRDIEYQIGETSFRGTLVYAEDAGESQPGIVMYPNWLGPSPESEEKARNIAKMGYVVFMADMYGVDVRPENMKEASDASSAVRADISMMRERARKALSVLLESNAPVDPASIAAIGFCFGGGNVLELARSGETRVQAVVSFHGNLNTPDPQDAQDIEAAILVLHGADDPFVPQKQVRAFIDEMQQAEVGNWQLVQFGGAVHSFTDPYAELPGKAEYNKRVAKLSFDMMNDFLAPAFDE